MTLKKTLTFIAILAISAVYSTALAGVPKTHSLSATVEDGEGLPSNSIIDLKSLNGSLWLGTGSGLAELHLDTGMPSGGWSTIHEEDGIGKGGISALYVSDSILWVATAYTENTNVGFLPAGGGVGYSRDDGMTWTWMEQPIDSSDITAYSPTVTNVQNVTYDIALSDSSVWITSWGGGLRKLKYGETAWQIVTPDDEAFSALRYNNHRGFSVVYNDGALVVGTAAGINVSLDEGDDWVNHSHDPSNPNSICGNFITAMAVQRYSGGSRIWAATWLATSNTEYNGVAVSENNGQTWRTVLSDSSILGTGEYLFEKYGQLKAHNFGFRGDTVWVAADKGLWRSDDGGGSWSPAPLQYIADPTTGEVFDTPDFFSVASVGDSLLFVGTDDGLAVSWFDADNVQQWRIHRAHSPAGVSGEVNTYAYPNPFSPRRSDFTRIQIPVNGSTTVSFKVFSFAMEEVFTSTETTLPGGGVGDMSGYGAVKWDGTDSSGDVVANGVYFYKISVNGNEWWGKILVLD